MSSSVDRVEVFSQIQRRRRWSVDQKLAILAEAAQPGMSISYVARRHGISSSLVFGWRRRMTEGGKEAVRADDEVVARAEVRELQKRIRELERDAALRLCVRERIKDGRLPAMVPPQVYAGAGSGRMCVACEQPIKSDQVEYGFNDYRDGKRLCFHLGCCAVWQIECARRA